MRCMYCGYKLFLNFASGIIKCLNCYKDFKMPEVEVSQEAPAVAVVEAVANTVAQPTPDNILEDVELAVSLIKQLKEEIQKLPPGALDKFKMLLHWVF